MDRRRFLSGSFGIASYIVFLGPVSATQSEQEPSVDFGQLVVGYFNGSSGQREEVQPVLGEIATTVYTESSRMEWEDSSRILADVGGADTAARRLEFVIQALHNNNMASYVDEAWVGTVRNGFSPVTRVLPLIGSYNNLYQSAEILHEARNSDEGARSRDYDQFAFALLAFGLELGLFYVGAPYRMAWRGTRFVSNRTLLRLGRWVDYRLIALVMSEIHWAIRSQIYEEINRENIGNALELAQSVADEIDSRRQTIQEMDVQTEDGEPYFDTSDLDMAVWDIARYEFIVDRVSGELTDQEIEGEFVVSDIEASSDGTDPDSDEGDPIPIDGVGI